MNRQYALNGESQVSRTSLTVIVLLGLFLAAAATAQTPGEDAARAAVENFGRGLAGGDLSLIRPLLPQKGKVQLNLARLGPERGSFSASQVMAPIVPATIRPVMIAYSTVSRPFSSETNRL